MAPENHKRLSFTVYTLCNQQLCGMCTDSWIQLREEKFGFDCKIRLSQPAFLLFKLWGFSFVYEFRIVVQRVPMICFCIIIYVSKCAASLV